jgi:hypothetical protein
MGRVPYSEFIGSRVRFQRINDQRVFAGWIKALKSDSAHFLTEEPIPVESNERFLCQVQGPSADAYFIAAATGMPVGTSSYVHGSTALKRVNMPALDYQFEIVTQVQFRDSQQHARKSIGAMVASYVNSDGHDSEVLVTDASGGGMGVIGWEEMKRGDTIEVEIQAGPESLCFHCEVRHCRVEPKIIGAYRLGLKFQNAERIALASWRKFISAD